MDASDQFAEIARQLAAEPDVSSTLDVIVSLAVEHVEGCDGAGILLAHGNEIVAGSWSDDLVQRVEKLEYELSEGPCVDAIRQQPVFESPDLRDHLDDWPHFAEAALDAGIESMLGFRLFVAEDTVGALDLYARQRGAFDGSSRAIGTVLAAHAALAFVGAQLKAQDLDTITGLQEALKNRDLIGQAKGILMVTHHIDADEAFTMLVKASQYRNIKLRNLAESVAATKQL